MKHSLLSTLILATVITTSHTTWCMWAVTQNSLGGITRIANAPVNIPLEEQDALVQRLQQMNENSPEWQETKERAEGGGCSMAKKFLNGAVFVTGLGVALFVPPLACKSGTCEAITLVGGLGLVLCSAVQFTIWLKRKKAAEYKIALLKEIKHCETI